MGQITEWAHKELHWEPDDDEMQEIWDNCSETVYMHLFHEHYQTNDFSGSFWMYPRPAIVMGNREMGEGHKLGELVTRTYRFRDKEALFWAPQRHKDIEEMNYWTFPTYHTWCNSELNDTCGNWHEIPEHIRKMWNDRDMQLQEIEHDIFKAYEAEKIEEHLRESADA